MRWFILYAISNLLYDVLLPAAVSQLHVMLHLVFCMAPALTWSPSTSLYSESVKKYTVIIIKQILLLDFFGE